MHFLPAKMGRAGEDVALQLEAAIIDGRILPGQSLPSERDLQAEFKTGRGVIREAMRALQQKGLIEIRKGAKGGAFVKQVEVAKASESLALFLKQQNVDPDYLVEFRESMDRTITILAVARGDGKEKRKLEKEALKLAALIEEDVPDMERLVEMDRNLNIRLAQMSGNPIFEWLMRAVQLGFSSHDHALYEDPEYRRETVANWLETTRQIAADEPMKALSSIGRHYILLRNRLAEKGGDVSVEKAGDVPRANG